jgi:hypothetical protein
MSGVAGCREIRQALGVYVLGAIDPAERAVVDEHLAVCQDCREELAGLAGLPAMLRKVPVMEAERLALSELDIGADELPTKELLDSLVARTTNVRRIHRWRGLVAAAAVAVLALGSGVALTKVLQQPSSPPPVPSSQWLQVAHTTAATGARIEVRYRPQSWGTDMEVHVSGVKPGTLCELLVTNSSGQSWPVGGWKVASWNDSVWYPATTWFDETSLHGFELAVGNKIVASVHAD